MAGGDSQRVGWGEVLNGRYATSLALVCLSVWLHAADSMLVATMIPAIVTEIGGTRLVSWTVSLYEIGSIVAGVSSALVTTRFGLRWPMALAGFGFAMGCVISAVAPSMWVLLAGRLLQGIGGGGLVAMSFVAVGLLFPRRLMPRALAAVSLLWGTSAFVGPLIGGLFVEFGSWRYGFVLFAIKAIVLGGWILASVRTIPGANDAAQTKQSLRFPVMRLAALCSGVLLIASAGVRISAVATPVLVVAGVCCLWAFIGRDSRSHQSRFLPRQPVGFANPVGAGLTMILCFTMASIAINIYGPLIMTGLHGASALTAGYIVACGSIGWTIAAVSVSGAPEHADRRLIGIGMVMLCVSLVGFVYSVARGPLWLIAVFSMLEGAGFGMAWTFILRRATALADATESERVAGAIPPMQRMGYALGAAYVGLVANAAGLETGVPNDILVQVSDAVFTASLPLAALGVYAAWCFLRHPRSDTPAPT